MYAQLTNEFDLGEQFALDYAGDPAGTQKAVANIRNTMYLPGPDGLANNDDLGAESSQFIWEMLGMYPENSGRGTLVFASPGFPKATIHLANGKAINIQAPGASPSTYYVQSLKLNGEPYSKTWVNYSKLTRGASLDWTLDNKPSSWGSAAADAPRSYTNGLRPVVGFLSEQNVTVAPGSNATIKVGAQNATTRRQAVHVDVLGTGRQRSSRLPLERHGLGITKRPRLAHSDDQRELIRSAWVQLGHGHDHDVQRHDPDAEARRFGRAAGEPARRDQQHRHLQ